MNPYERAARFEKARKLEYALVAAWEAMPEAVRSGRSLADAVESSPRAKAMWSSASRSAGVREPSDETKAVVIRGLRLRERQMASAELFAGQEA